MSEISGKVIIMNSEIRTEEELHLKSWAFLYQCTIYCDALIECDGPNKNAIGCLIYSKAGVGACYDSGNPEEGGEKE